MIVKPAIKLVTDELYKKVFQFLAEFRKDVYTIRIELGLKIMLISIDEFSYYPYHGYKKTYEIKRKL